MTIKTIFHKPIRRELELVADELRSRDPAFDPAHEPWHLTAVVLVWCVREICKLREANRG
jgi:hypothetical protein